MHRAALVGILPGLLLCAASCGSRPAPLKAPTPPQQQDSRPEQPPIEKLGQLPETSEPSPRSALTTKGDDTLNLTPTKYSGIPGWRGDLHGEALVAFRASCEKLAILEDDERVGTGPYGGTARHWRAPCEAAKKIPNIAHKRARRFFEQFFNAYAAEGNAGATGRITGYYVQPLRAARKRGGRYQFPLYKRPADLVAVKLDDFVEDGRSRRVWGRISEKSGRLVPYPTRREFEERLGDAKEEAVLLWLDSPADVVLVGIEGSGRATLKDGSVVMVAFAGKNGRKSAKRGAARKLRSFEAKHGKKRWKATDLARVRAITQEKDSMVFFELENRPGAIGSQNVVLTPGRSLAVDRAVVPLSTPIWVDTRAPAAADAAHTAWRHLVIAQDTGGAILGTVRGDIYFGDDDDAVAIGRRVNGPGRMWLLLPKGVPQIILQGAENAADSAAQSQALETESHLSARPRNSP